MHNLYHPNVAETFEMKKDVDGYVYVRIELYFMSSPLYGSYKTFKT